MKYYQYLDLPNWKSVANQALEYYYIHREKYFENNENPYFLFAETDTDDVLEKIPELNTILSPLNATVKCIFYFEICKYLPADDFIHIDNTPFDSRILIPLLNCDDSETRYYTSNAEPTYVEKKIDDDYVVAKKPIPGTYVHVDSYYLNNGPVLMRPNEIHSVSLPENQEYPRIALLVMTHEDLTYHLA